MLATAESDKHLGSFRRLDEPPRFAQSGGVGPGRAHPFQAHRDRLEDHVEEADRKTRGSGGLFADPQLGRSPLNAGSAFSFLGSPG